MYDKKLQFYYNEFYLKDFSKQIADLVKENATLKLSNSDLIKVNEEVSQNFKVF